MTATALDVFDLPDGMLNVPDVLDIDDMLGSDDVLDALDALDALGLPAARRVGESGGSLEAFGSDFPQGGKCPATSDGRPPDFLEVSTGSTLRKVERGSIRLRRSVFA